MNEPLGAAKRRLFGAIATFLVLMVVGGLAEGMVRALSPQPLNGTWGLRSERGHLYNKASGTAQHQAAGRTVRYRFNDRHLRGEAIDTAATKVLVLGDSYTFGWLIDEADCLVGRLQNAAHGALDEGTVQFLNGGIAGSGSAAQLAFLEEFGPDIAPDAVLVMLNVDDIGRSLRDGPYVFAAGEEDSLRLPPYRLGAAGRLSNLVKGHAVTQRVLERAHAVQLIRRAMRWKSSHAKPGGPIAPDLVIPGHLLIDESPETARRLGRAVFRRMKRWCDDRNIPFWVATTGFESLYPISRIDSLREATAVFLSTSAAFFGRERIPYYPLAPAIGDSLRRRLDHYLIPDDYHPNESGHRLMARALWPWLALNLETLPRRNNSALGP